MFEPVAFMNVFGDIDREIPGMAFIFTSNKQPFEAMRR